MKRISLVLVFLALALLFTGCSTSLFAGQQPTTQLQPTVSATPTTSATIPDLYDLTQKGLYALDSRTGKQFWHASVPYGPNAPLVLSGNALYTEDGWYLYAFDVHQGTLLWKYAYGTHQVPDYTNDFTTLLLGQHAMYIVSASDSTPALGITPATGPTNMFTASVLSAVDLASGKLLWKHALNYRLNTLDISGDTIYGIGSTAQHGVLYALKGSDGSILWQDPLLKSEDSYYGLVADSGKLYFVSTGRSSASQAFLYAFDQSSGQQLWRASEPLSGSYNSNIVVADGILYYGMGDNTLYAFKIDNGDLLWKSTFSSAILNQTVPVLNGQAYVFTATDSSAQIHMLDTTSGLAVGSYLAPQEALSFSGLFVVSHDILYLSGSDSPSGTGNLFLFNPTTGEQLTHYALPADSGTPNNLTLVS